MMEEVSDDTNGESSFEFVSGKVDELPKDDSSSMPPGSHFYQTPVDPSRNYAVPTANPASTSTVTFYQVDPKDSKSVMLPPPIPSNPSPQAVPSTVVPPKTMPYAPASSSYPSPPAAPSFAQSPPEASYPSPQQSSQTFSVPPAAPFYSSPPAAQQALTLSLDASAAGPLPQQQTERGVWGWIKGNEFLHKVAEKAKNSVDSVITTLDPGMKEIINSGGDVTVIVASGNEDKISAVREAFQFVFGKATVQGVAVQSNSIAPQPVGFSAGLKAAEERINNLKQMGFSQDRQILVAIENFLAEFTPENWFDVGCLLLQDQSSGISLQVYTEAIPIPSQYIAMARDQTPPDYPLGWSGYAVTIGQIMGPALNVHHSLWHQALTGVSRREILFVSAKTLAGLYRSRLGYNNKVCVGQ